MQGTLWGGRVLRTFAAAKTHLAINPALLKGFSLAFGMHLLTVLITYCFARSLDLSISYLQALVLVPMVALLIMLPITISGHGLREVFLIAYFAQIGVASGHYLHTGVRELAVALSLLLVTNDLLWSIPGGIWYFKRFKAAPRPSEDPGPIRAT
jgi:uncharacterized membrane protein YbhN (UPF0104 family)